MADKGTRGDFTPQELPKHAAGAQACLHVLEIAKTFPRVSRFSQTRLSDQTAPTFAKPVKLKFPKNFLENSMFPNFLSNK